MKRPKAECKVREWKTTTWGCGDPMVYKGATQNKNLDVYMCPNCDLTPKYLHPND